MSDWKVWIISGTLHDGVIFRSRIRQIDAESGSLHSYDRSGQEAIYQRGEWFDDGAAARSAAERRLREARENLQDQIRELSEREVTFVDETTAPGNGDGA
jgi:hypothetical protein